MNIKKVTLIALCGNAVWLSVQLFYNIRWFFEYHSFHSFIGFLSLIAGPGTLLLFLFTLYRKQP